MAARSISRRSILRGAAAGGAVAAMGLIGVPLIGKATEDPSPRPDRSQGPPGATVKEVKDSPGLGVTAPGFVTGTIVVLGADTLLIKTVERDVLVDATTAELIWRGRPDAFDELLVGDHVDITGSVRADGVVEAKFVEANIVQLRGPITNIGAAGFSVSDERHGMAEGIVQVLLDEQYAPEVYRGGARVSGMDARVSTNDVGTYVMIIGLQLVDGRVAATKLWLDPQP